MLGLARAAANRAEAYGYSSAARSYNVVCLSWATDEAAVLLVEGSRVAWRSPRLPILDLFLVLCMIWDPWNIPPSRQLIDGTPFSRQVKDQIVELTEEKLERMPCRRPFSTAVDEVPDSRPKMHGFSENISFGSGFCLPTVGA